MLGVAALLFSSLLSPAYCGSYLESDNTTYVPGIVVHPTLYTGTGGAMELKVCLHADAGPLLGDLEFAMKRLNDLAPQRMNCSGLCTSAQTPVMGTNFSAGAIVLHELEHCAFGLDHINRERPSLTPPHQDYTRLREETTVGVGADGVRGSADDHPLPFPGARLLHWFRLSATTPSSWTQLQLMLPLIRGTTSKFRMGYGPQARTTLSRNFLDMALLNPRC